jgi:hypothetical protein
MANFGDSRFGFSSKTIWVSLAVVGVVVGLFFIPALINGQFANRHGGQRAQNRQATPQKPPAPQNAQPSEPQGGSQQDRAALNSDSLMGVQSTVRQEQGGGTAAQKPQQKRLGDVDPNPSDEGFFSGFKVSARGDDAKYVKGFSLDKLGNKEGQTFFKRGSADATRFIEKNAFSDPTARNAALALVAGMDRVAAGIGKNVNPQEVGASLVELHTSALRAMSATLGDRGLILDWLQIPAVKVIESSTGGVNERALQDRFAPRILIRSLTIRQRQANDGSYDPSAKATVSAEIAVKGSDVDQIGFAIGGQHQRDIRLSRPGRDGYRSFKVNGDGFGLWSFVAYDKYGARPFTKNYAFFPRVQRFSQAQDGTFAIAFTPTSAKNSLDRFFAVSQTVAQGSRDPAIGTF